MAECTCPRKTHLHLANCPSVQTKVKTALYTLQEEAFTKPNCIFFYVAVNEQGAVLQRQKFKGFLHDSDWLYQVETGAVGTITLANGTEITFCPESEALNILNLPTPSYVFLEKTNASKDIAEVLTPQTLGLCFVNPETKEIL